MSHNNKKIVKPCFDAILVAFVDKHPSPDRLRVTI